MRKSIRTDLPNHQPYGAERDACAIYLGVRKHGRSSFGTVRRALKAVGSMGHRTGFLNGEGDGAGVQTDTPRRLWASWLGQAGMRSSIATSTGFWVGHLFVPCDLSYSGIRDVVNGAFISKDLTLLIEQPGRVREEALGIRGGKNPPQFWQVAGLGEGDNIDSRLLSVQHRLEQDLGVHFASLSTSSVVYKALGSVETLARYYPDLQDNRFDTSMAICHARYSTNTVSSFERAQPFALLGHNGEINTICKFRDEAVQMRIGLPAEASDSQIIDRALHTFCAENELSLIEAMEMVFPPTPSQLAAFAPEIRESYQRLRQAFGPFAQGPAAIVARYGNSAVMSVDALGLRPLWFIETEKEYIFSSERGVVPFELMVCDPRPLAPGEKMAVIVDRGQDVQILNHRDIRDYVCGAGPMHGSSLFPDRPVGGGIWQGGFAQDWQPAAHRISEQRPAIAEQQTATETAVALAGMSALWLEPRRGHDLDDRLLAANGWERDHLTHLASMAKQGKDPVGSLGYDGPLAVLATHRTNLADYFKETVAVVTNPAIDRGREIEVFSTGALIGARPRIKDGSESNEPLLTTELPILTGGHAASCTRAIAAQAAEAMNTLTIEHVLAFFNGRAEHLTLGIERGETIKQALNRLSEQAVTVVGAGARCLLLDDERLYEDALDFLDPVLATRAVDRALREDGGAGSLRRKVGIVVRAAAIRDLHDMVLLLGFGADVLNPYALLGMGLRGCSDDGERCEVLIRLLTLFKTGLEKIISTIGCHELRGYGRVFSSIGLAPSVARFLEIANYFGSDFCGLTWERLREDAAIRGAELRGQDQAKKPASVGRFTSRFWKAVNKFARAAGEYQEVASAFEKLTSTHPVAMRHVLGFVPGNQMVDPQDVDISIGDHSMPLVIGAMSFGSQGEGAFKAYAQAAANLNILSINGEGGELPELLRINNKNRGQQIASGRFGVNATLLNSAAVLEIKIGQGAKPGEGGMLPSTKVIPRVAQARHTPPYVPLLSPSNNHDLYSIEDLAQLIEELKTVSPETKISVKCPVVPNIGVIVVGVAKAGADIINLSGYDGGTGAARKHALRHVGLPAEIGVIQAHRALVDAGMRNSVELWCDGGMKTGVDAVMMILLGANRVGFATMAMIAAGCTVCRNCHEGNCHVGITTHIKSVEEAHEKGLRRFVPFSSSKAVDGVVRLFQAIGEEMREIAAQLGAHCLQDLVGRGDLLQQVRFDDQIDLGAMLEDVPLISKEKLEPGVGYLLTRPRNNLTRFMSELVVEKVNEGKREITYQDEIKAYDRAIGSHLVGELARKPELRAEIDCLHVRIGPSSVAGNGFASWVGAQMDFLIEGGAQDGVAKGASGGRVAVMKGLNNDGQRIDGGVGKSFAYGAQDGTLIVQGNADSRACIRLSGADVVFGGEISQPIDPANPDVGSCANLKGFACEYMTSGRVLIMGDPGPYAFAGMTGGVVFQRLTLEMGFDVGVLQARIAEGAEVGIHQIDETDLSQIQELLGKYIEALNQTHQYEEANRIRELSSPAYLSSRFVKILPLGGTFQVA